MKQKVIVAMSGGVDSSVAAALLKEKGYDVIGITMQVWPSEKADDLDRFGGCCSLQAVEDARRVANKLDIPYYVLNFGQIFNQKVFNNFIDEYENGRTPNPCIRCNQFIKFEALLDKAKALEADYIATGHYARIEFDEDKSRYLLYRGIDEDKDQSYVLYTMTQEQLSKTLMPLGKYSKKETREMARSFGLDVAEKEESQEICFIPENDYRIFVKTHRPEIVKKGPIYDVKGKKIGEHEGIIHYTIGQRKGLGVSSESPLFITGINKEENSITVGGKENLEKQGLLASQPNFIPFKKLEDEIDASVQIRYNMKPFKAKIEPENGKVRVLFKDEQKSVTPGQAVVIYKKDLVIGGATIDAPISKLDQK